MVKNTTYFAPYLEMLWKNANILALTMPVQKYII